MKTLSRGKNSRVMVGVICTLLSLDLAASSRSDIDSKVPDLCEEASRMDNYEDSYLKNFKTLQQGAPGWIFRSMELKYQYGPGPKMLERLKRVRTLLKEQGTILVMVPIPPRSLVHPDNLGDIGLDVERAQKSYSGYLSALRSIGIAVPNLEILYDYDAQQSLFFARDHHWNSLGAKLIAIQTAKIILDSAVYTELTKRRFSTFSIGVQDNNGSLQKAAEKMCRRNYPDEQFEVFNTVMRDEIDAFSEVEKADVVLIGTSNSRGKKSFNFSGFLSQFSGVPVENRAQSGGGYDKAIIEYLSSDVFRENPPRFLVWELPGYYSLNTPSFYDRLQVLLKGEL